MMKSNKHWYDYLFIFSAAYLILGVFNILFAYLGLLCFFIPLGIAVFGKNKSYCSRYCGRGQLLYILGTKAGLSAGRDVPRFIKSKAFRYGFLIFFLIMFFNMLFGTYMVFAGAKDLKEAVTVLWTFKIGWSWAYSGGTADWAAQFAFGFYSVMLTSTILGIVTMVLFKPRSWCVYCPMGTMTQAICRIGNRKELHSEEFSMTDLNKEQIKPELSETGQNK